MNEKVARIFRRQANEASRQTAQALAPDIAVAIRNEEITRGRVDVLEAWAAAFSKMSRWERVKWLLR